MNCLFDSSVLLKRYDDDEAGHARVAQIVDDSNNQVIVSRLAQTEVISALARKSREGRHRERLARSLDVLQDDCSELIEVMALDDEVFVVADELLLRRALRAADAIHIATAISLRRSVPDLVFYTADRRQADAARAEGLTVEAL